ncbi:thyroid receptor-interacting protein 11-like [Limulus polyphemus]|uniref:Thyroid receptor-interacting protein 11-like n=1 Tax=Limulus polyphemus TaxID=6850 RepID=A0ABM1BC55_LIMPO|nr:thyroid receptor-interacting protein 11-like [Limulus polyphemus]
MSWLSDSFSSLTGHFNHLTNLKNNVSAEDFGQEDISQEAYTVHQDHAVIGDKYDTHLGFEQNTRRDSCSEETTEELKTMIEELKAERDSLSDSLLELDAQHQEAITKILSLKQELSDANTQLKKEVATLKLKLQTEEQAKTLLETEVETLREQITQIYRPTQYDNVNDKSSENSDSEILHGRPQLAIGLYEKDTTNEEEAKASFNSIISSLHAITTDNCNLEEKLSCSEKEIKKLNDVILSQTRKIESLSLQYRELQNDYCKLRQCAEKQNNDQFKKKIVTSIEMIKKSDVKQMEANKNNIDESFTSENMELNNIHDQETILESKLKNELENVNRFHSVKKEEESSLKSFLNGQEVEYFQNHIENLKTLLQDNETSSDEKSVKDLEEMKTRIACLSEQLQLSQLNFQFQSLDETEKDTDVKSLLKKLYFYEMKNKELADSLAATTEELSQLRILVKNEKNPLQVQKASQTETEYYENDTSVVILHQNMNDLALNRLKKTGENLVSEENVVKCEYDKTETDNFDKLCSKTTQSNKMGSETDCISDKSEFSKKNSAFHDNSVYLGCSEKQTSVRNCQNELVNHGNTVEELDTEQVNLSSKLIEEKEMESDIKKFKFSSEKSSESYNTLSDDSNNLNLKDKNEYGRSTSVSASKPNKDSIERENDFEHGNIKQKNAEISMLNKKIEVLMKLLDQSDSSKCSLKNQVDKVSCLEDRIHCLQTEKEQLLTVINEKSRECSNYKSEVYRLVNIVSAEKQALNKLQKDNQDIVRQQEIPDKELTRETIQNLSRIICDKDLEIESLRQKSDTLLALVQDPSLENVQINSLLEEKNQLSKQLHLYQSDREEIVKTLDQKHQENVKYHDEIQRLNELVQTQCEKYEKLEHQHHTICKQFEDKKKSLINTQNELIVVRQKLSSLELQFADLKQIYHQAYDRKQSTKSAQIQCDLTNDEFRRLSEVTTGKVLWNHDKDHVILELSSSIQKQKEAISEKESEIVNLKKIIKNFDSNKGVSEKEWNSCEGITKKDMELQLESTRAEMLKLEESNKKLTTTVQEQEFELKALQDKVVTLSELVQQQSQSGDNKGSQIERLLMESSDMLQKAQKFQREKDEALLSLSQQQAENVDLQNKVRLLEENEIRMYSEVERLRSHLLQIEEMYTKEALNAEEREKSLRQRLVHAEEKVRESSTAASSASENVNLQVENLEEQLELMTKQRDKALEQVSQLEDQVQHYAASLGNLQLVLEHFQKEQERNVRVMEKNHQTELDKEKKKYQDLLTELNKKEECLSETLEALHAASRLSEQLDKKEETIQYLKEKLSRQEESLIKTQEQTAQLQVNMEGKVDKQVMKNLVLGYFNTPPCQQPEVVRLLARILDFNQEELNKAGIVLGRNKSRTGKSSGWFSSIFGKVNTSTQSPSREVIDSPYADKSFSALFVQFLQNESQLIRQVSLPAEEMAMEVTNKSITTGRPVSNYVSVVTTKKDNSGISQATKNVSVLSSGDHSKHPLMRPMPTSLPTLTPVPVVPNHSETNTFLREVLK